MRRTAMTDPASRRAAGQDVPGQDVPPDVRPPDPPPSNAPRSPSPHDLAELPEPFALTVPVHDPEPIEEPDGRAPGPERIPGPQRVPVADPGTGDETPTERGLRGLVGGGSSQVSVTAALRARDAARPRDTDLSRAETDLVIVRRGWVPRDDLPRGTRR
jgi:hypothetical protein